MEEGTEDSMTPGYSPTAAREDLARWKTSALANPFRTDEQLQRALQRFLGDRFSTWEPHPDQVGAEVASLFPLVEELEREGNMPELVFSDAFGNATEEVVFQPLWERVGRVFWGSGVLSLLAQPGQELAAGAILYLLDQLGEAGHACPLACTAGAIKLIQQVVRRRATQPFSHSET